MTFLSFGYNWDPMGYNLTLSYSDMEDISFVGGRYSWAETLLQNTEIGDNDIPEHVAWEMKEAFEEDCEGGHSMFPMLSEASNLYEKLSKFYKSIV